VSVPQLRDQISSFLLNDPVGQFFTASHYVTDEEIIAQRPGRPKELNDNYYASEVTFQAAAHLFQLQINCLTSEHHINGPGSRIDALIFYPLASPPPALPPLLTPPSTLTFLLQHKHVDGIYPLSFISSLPSVCNAPHLPSLPATPSLRLINTLISIPQRSTKRSKTKSNLTSRLPGLPLNTPPPPKCQCPPLSPCLPSTCANSLRGCFCHPTCSPRCLNSFPHFRPMSLLQSSRPDGSPDILASTGIPKGSIIHQFTGEVTRLDPTQAITPLIPASAPFLRRCGPFLINAYEYGNVTRFIRASRTPNIDLVPLVTDSDGSTPLSGLFLRANQDIPAFTPLFLPLIDFSTPEPINPTSSPAALQLQNPVSRKRPRPTPSSPPPPLPLSAHLTDTQPNLPTKPSRKRATKLPRIDAYFHRLPP